MSAAEKEIFQPRPEELAWTPWIGPDEVERARLEDPEFPEVLARKRAMAKNETYSRERHGPHDRALTRKQKQEAPITRTVADGNLSDVIARFLDKGSKSRLVPKEADHQPRNPYIKAL